jgi:hypothetical protein
MAQIDSKASTLEPLWSKADMCNAILDVRLGPKAVIPLGFIERRFAHIKSQLCN